jgi:hypothetical protein
VFPEQVVELWNHGVAVRAWPSGSLRRLAMSLPSPIEFGTKGHPPHFEFSVKTPPLLFHFGVRRAGRYVPPSNR